MVRTAIEKRNCKARLRGIDITVLSCHALLAGQTRVAPECGGSTFILTFMPRASHFDKLREIDPASWKTSFCEAARRLDVRFKPIFLCYNEIELQAARTLWPHHRAVFPQTTSDHFNTVRDAYSGLVHRLHTALGLAGLGIPSIAVGTNTRMWVTKKIGIETVFAPGVACPMLVQHLERLLEWRDAI